MKPEWLNRAIVNAPYYCLCLTPKAFRSALDHIEAEEYPTFLHDGGHATTHHFEYQGKKVALVCMDPGFADDPIVIAGLLTHEAVHIWQKAVKLHREFIDQDGEFEAYSIQWISQQLMWEYVRQTKGQQ